MTTKYRYLMILYIFKLVNAVFRNLYYLYTMNFSSQNTSYQYNASYENAGYGMSVTWKYFELKSNLKHST